MEGEKYPYGFLLNAKISIFFTLFSSDIGSSCLFWYCNTWAFGSSNGQSVPETPRNSAARGPGNYQGRGCKILRGKIIQRWCPLENDLNWTDSDKVYNLWEFHTIYASSTQIPMVNTVESLKFAMAQFLWISWASLDRNFINKLWNIEVNLRNNMLMHKTANEKKNGPHKFKWFALV